MKLTNLAIILFGLLIVFFFLTRPTISNYENTSAYGDPSVPYSLSPETGACSSHCARGTDGNIMDIQDCCECQASGGVFEGETDAYDTKFRSCMCQNKRNDYCFKPVTNFLLSQ